MDCDKASYRVYGYLDGELTVWRRWTIRRHLDKCPPCAQGFDFEIELRQVIVDEVPRRGARRSCSRRIAEALGAPIRPTTPAPRSGPHRATTSGVRSGDRPSGAARERPVPASPTS